jgi:hypothetical protein
VDFFDSYVIFKSGLFNLINMRRKKHAILLIYDESEEKTEAFEVIKLCHCVRNNSLDRAKILIRYLRKKLRFKDSQISFLRTSGFKNAISAANKFKSIIDEHENDNILFYYSGHGISENHGWCLGKPGNKSKYLFYGLLGKIFKSFLGKLVFINDCCYALAVEPYLKDLEGRYLLFGSSRAENVSSISVLDSILWPWQDSLPAFPKVYKTRIAGGETRDYPIYYLHDRYFYCLRGSYHSCNCGTLSYNEEIFQPADMPSLRRGSNLDHLFFSSKPR